MIRYRAMTEADIPAGLRLCRAARWNQVEDDWRIFLEASPEGNRVAERDGVVVGTVATLPYGGRFTWVSMVLVDPAERGHGIGTALLEQALELIGPGACARLDATPAGQPIYERMGFSGEFEISRMTTLVDQTGDAEAEPLDEDGLQRRRTVDEAVFGADRAFLLHRLMRRASHFARAVEGAHSLGRQGFLYDQVGPMVAENVGAAQAVFAACLRGATGHKAVIDAPRLNPDWIGWLESLGFREERRLLRMSRGPNPFPGRPGDMYAIAGPELG